MICALSLQINFPEIRPLYFILKVFLKERNNLDQTRDGGICSFMLLNMIAFYLQTHYKDCLQTYNFKQTQIQSWSRSSAPKLDKDGEMAKATDLELHMHLMRFFQFYAEELDQSAFYISIRKGGFMATRNFAMEAENSCGNQRGGPRGNKLHIESPLDILEDVAAGAFNYNLVK